MWQNIIVATDYMLAWLLFVTLAFNLLSIGFANNAIGFWEKVGVRPFLFVMLIALIVRIIPMILLPVGAGYDIESFHLVGEALLNGEDVYTSAAAGRHPYLPFQMYWVGFAFYLQRITAVPFVILVKLVPVFSDVAITAVIYKTCRRWQKSHAEAVQWALLFALNPVAILVSAYHGQFDSVAVLLLFLAWYFWEFGQRTIYSPTALGFAILNKSWPIVLLPIVLIRTRNWKHWIVYSGIALLIPTAFTVAYIFVLDTDSVPMLRRALTHTGPSGYWGLSALLTLLKKQIAFFEPLYNYMVAWRRWLILAAGLFTLWWTRKETIVSALTTIILAIFAVSAGMGIQWLLWLIPFAILDEDHHWLKWYSITGSIFLLVQLYGLHMYPWLYELFQPETADSLVRWGSIPIWLTVTFWVVYRMKRLPATDNYLMRET